MKAVALKAYLPIDNPQSLLDVELEKPVPQERDLLVAVSAISVNPVDTKVRAPKDKLESQPRVLGWDAVGIVEAVGSAVTLFKPGDRVYYAGDITRPGCNSEYQLIDERIVGRAPSTLSDAEAAALPLTAITAWEGLFDRLHIERNGGSGKTLLIIGGAGGVGSIAIQLAKQLTKATVIATASRAESREWCLAHGADAVVDHNDLLNSMRASGHENVDYIFCLNNTEQHWPSMCELIKPQGAICSIVETKHPVNLTQLQSKSATFVWELMFTRSMFKTDDMIEQHRLLNELSELVDTGKIKTTISKTLSPINAKNLREAHAQLESGRTIGKVVLEGWHS